MGRKGPTRPTRRDERQQQRQDDAKARKRDASLAERAALALGQFQRAATMPETRAGRRDLRRALAEKGLVLQRYGEPHANDKLGRGDMCTLISPQHDESFDGLDEGTSEEDIVADEAPDTAARLDECATTLEGSSDDDWIDLVDPFGDDLVFL
ncbi:hypothetical protein AaE_007656 [Aphanomyces astaci]|uniref:Uncharacterized protein n=1 Tax=Aphanomyces astaci TaxID=112090 RepID=A0A6A5ADW6_APHAT|nr:hypothetical protein AaE_007656 [Aphanomyces astaci]